MLPESASSNSRSLQSSVSCERCGAPAELATLVHPLGATPGARVHQCAACNHMTWIEWWGWHGRAPEPAQEQQQAQDGKTPLENGTAR